ncbi:hypothetical protein D3C85_1656710 [compost metagenome]
MGYDPQATKPQWIPGLEKLQKYSNSATLPIGLYNLWHQHAALPSDAISRFVTHHVDGKTAIADLRTLLRDALANGTVAHPSGKSLKRVRNLDSVAQTLLSDVIGRLRSEGVLL